MGKGTLPTHYNTTLFYTSKLHITSARVNGRVSNTIDVCLDVMDLCDTQVGTHNYHLKHMWTLKCLHPWHNCRMNWRMCTLTRDPMVIRTMIELWLQTSNQHSFSFKIASVMDCSTCLFDNQIGKGGPGLDHICLGPPPRPGQYSITGWSLTLHENYRSF
jgi:hypothetical protein